MKNNYKTTVNPVRRTGWLLKICLLLIFGFASTLQAQVVTTISPASSSFITGSVNAGGTKNNGDMISLNTGANRGWCSFSLASIPAGSTITAVTAQFTTFTSVLSTGINNVKVFTGNPVTDAGATVYTNIGAVGGGTVANSSSWTAAGLQTKVFTAPGVAACQAAIGGNINIGYVRGSTNNYNVYGYTASATNQPKLVITYTPPAIANDLTLINPSTPSGTLCAGSASTTVSVTLKNNGTALADFSVDPVTVTASVTGPNGTTFTPVVINSGTLASGATQVVNIAVGYNASLFGTYNFSSSVAWTPDGFAGNNSLNWSASSSFPVVASSNSYTFCDGTIPQLSTSAIPTKSAGPTGDDAVLTGIALPFAFSFDGVAQSTVNIYTNGFMQFGASSGSTTVYGATIPSPTAPNNIIALAFGDLNITSGTIKYFTAGSTPNRKFVVEFNNGFFYQFIGNVSGQIVLNEVDNTIDIFHTNITNAGTASAVCGVENATGTSGTVATGRQFAIWSPSPVLNEGWKFTYTGSGYTVASTPYALVTIPVTYSWSPTGGLSDPNIANPTATLASGTSVVYTVTASSGGCDVSDTVSLTNLGGGDLAPTTTSAAACAGASATLSASGASTLNWYTAAIGGTIAFTGTTWNNTWASTTTYYVESNNGTCPSARTPVTITVTAQPVINPTATPSVLCLGASSQLAANNYVSGNLQTAVAGGNGASGNAFNISNLNGSSPIRIDSVYMGIASGTLAEVWYIPGGYGCAVLSSSAGWTLAGQVAITPAGGTPNLTSIPLNLNITIPVGQTYGFVVVCNGTNYYTNGATVCAPWAGDANISISQGHGGAGLGGAFSFPNNPRNFNGRVFYSFGDPNLTFNWSQTVGTGAISNPAIANPTATPTSSGLNTYELLAINAANCSTTVAVNVTANPIPADATGLTSGTTFCGCGVATLNATLAPGSDVRWYTVATGGTSIGTGTPFNAPYACGPQTYYAEAFDPITGCVQSGPRASYTFTPLVGPAVTVSATDLNLCDGDPASTITAVSVNDPNYVYTWSPTTGLTNISNGVVSALPTVTTTYTVSGFDAVSGCLEQAVITIGVGITPTIAGASATPAAYCVGGSSQLNVSAFSGGFLPPAPSGYPANGASIIDDEDIDGVVFGSLSNIQTPGLCALYTDYTGLTAPLVNAGQSVPFSITIGDCENSSFWASGTSVFIDYNRDGDFGDAGELAYTTSATTTGIHTLSGNIVISNLASTGYTRMRIINVEGIVSPTFDQIYSYGETEDYTVGIQGGSALSYLWSPATGLSSTTIGNPIANPTTSQNYTVIVTDGGGCSASTSVPVAVVAPPAPPTITDGTRCGPGTVNLSALGAGGTILWLDTIGGPILTTGNNYSPAVTSTQTYYVVENPSAAPANVGFSATALGTTAFASASANYQTFNVLSPGGIIINSVDIVPNPLTALGTAIAIQLEDAAGNPLGAPVSTVTATQGTVQTITLDMFVPQGTAYRLRPVSNPNLQYHQNGFVNPYTLPGQVSITGWGGPNATTLYVFFYNWSVSTFDGVSAGCYSAPSIATATVTPAPALAITPSGSTSYCDAGSVGLDGATASDPSYVNFSWSPATGLSATNVAVVTASPSVTTTYTLTADDGLPNGCSNTATVTITVNSGPTVSIDPAPFDSLCSGASFVINASSGSSSFKQVGAGTNTANNTIAIYDGNNPNVKTQVLYTAAELNAAGLIGPGNITSAAFNVVNKLSTTPLVGFTMRMGSVATAPPLTAAYLAPVFTTVFTGSVSTVLGWNQHVFTTPFFWDGSSNVILEVCNGTPGIAGFDQVQSTPTATAQTIIANLLGCTSGSGAVNLNRPNTRFTGGTVNYSWAPAGELSASNIEDPTYTATSDGAKSLVLTVTDPANGCTATATLNFTISGTPKAPAIATSSNTAICVSANVSVTASGTTGAYQWQSSTDNSTWGDIVGETNATLNILVTADIYFRVKASCTNDAFSNSIFFDVTSPAVPVGTGATVCGQGNVSLSATVDPGLFDVWYTAATGGTFLQVGSPLNVFVNTTTTYYVAASVAPIAAPGPPPSGYLTSNATSTADEDISNVTFGALNNSSTCLTTGGPGSVLNQYSDYTALTAEIVAPGQSVPYSVTQTSCGGAFSNRTAIFIDYNRDGDFLDVDENPVLTAAVVGNNTASGSIIIPLTASVGFTRMRVINVETTGTISPTGTYTWGETEDYLVQIGASVCQSARVPVVATVTAPPALTIDPASATICEGDTVLLVDVNGNYPGNYSWDNGLTIINAADGSAYAAPSVTTSYILIGNDGICENADTVIITVNPAPVFTMSTTTPSVCGGGTADASVNITSPLAGTYSVNTIPFAPVTCNANAGPSGDDAVTGALPLGFTFNYFGVNYTDLGISTNGNVQLGVGPYSASFSPNVIPTAGIPDNMIAPFWGDLNASPGQITYGTSGVAPNRQFIVCYNNVAFFNGTDFVTGQVILFEGTNRIEMHITSVTGISFSNRVLGIENATGTVGYSPGTLGTPAVWALANTSYAFVPDAAATIGWTGPNIISATNIPTITAQPASNSYYVATVTNPATGCTAIDSILIQASGNPQPFLTRNGAALTATTLCNPDTIIIRVSDLTYPLGYPAGTTFTWSAIGVPIVGLDSISSNNGSSYDVIVTLPSSCTGTSNTVIVLTKSVAVVDVINNATCSGGGSIEVTVTSGLPNYNYVWSTDLAQTNIVRNVTKTSNKDTLPNLTAGTYYLQVYDEAGTPASCNSGVLTYIVGGSSSIVASVTPTDITCNGNANGAADVTWTGGNSPFSITWSDGTFANTTPRTIALGGSYSVIVSDLSGCADTVAFAIVEPSPVTVTFTSTPESFPGALDGTVTATPAGGTGPYAFAWADELFVPAGSGNPLIGLAGGLYYGLVTDANACDNSATVLDDSIRVDVITSATFNVTALFEGFYDGVSGLVPALLNSGVGLSATECDTIYVELRDQLSPTTVLASGTAVMNTNGQASFTFPGSVIGQNGYIAIFHRNAVQTWSDVVTFSGVTNYNFTTAATQAFGSNQVQVAPGVWAMYSGDLSPQDEFIDILDQGVIDNDIFNFAGGYVVSDLNGDGFVDIVDQSIVDNNIFNFIGSVHP